MAKGLKNGRNDITWRKIHSDVGHGIRWVEVMGVCVWVWVRVRVCVRVCVWVCVCE